MIDQPSYYFRISVSEARGEMFPGYRGKNSVDRGWIDIKANNYFNNEEYQADKKISTNKKPEWKNVYSKDNFAPAEGAVNAFQFQEL